MFFDVRTCRWRRCGQTEGFARIITIRRAIYFLFFGPCSVAFGFWLLAFAFGFTLSWLRGPEQVQRIRSSDMAGDDRRRKNDMIGRRRDEMI